MPNDITLQSMFDYPKQGIVNGLEFSLFTKVIATFGEHLANTLFPQGLKAAPVILY